MALSHWPLRVACAAVALSGCNGESPMTPGPTASTVRNWTAVAAPLGGSPSSVLVHSSGAFLVGTEDEGVYRGSPESGWLALATHRTTPRVEAMIEGAEGAVITASFAGLFRSADVGATWSKVGPEDQSYLALARRDGEMLAGSFRSGILSSDDGGRTWQPKGASLPGPILALATTQDRVYAGTYNGVFTSADDCQSWELILSLGLANALFAEGDLILAGSRFGGLYRSIDRGGTWTSLGDGFAPFPGAFPQGIARLSDGHLVLWMDFAVFVSSDDGGTWVRESWPPRDRISQVTPAGETILVASEDGLWAWTPTTGWALAGLHPLAVSAALRIDGEVYVGAWKQLSGGLYEWRSGALQPVALRDMAIRDLTALPSGTVLAAASSLEEPGLGGLFRKEGPGDVWIPVVPRGADFLSLVRLSGGELIAGSGPSAPLSPEGSFAQAFRSSTDGITWEPWSEGLSDAGIVAILELEGSTGTVAYALGETADGSRTILWRSRDGPAWRVARLPADVDLSRSAWTAVSDGSLLTAAKPEGLVRASVDGTSVEREPGPFAGATVESLAWDGIQLYAGTSNGLWVRSHEGEWAAVSAVPTDAQILRIRLAGRDLVVMTVAHGVFFGEASQR